MENKQRSKTNQLFTLQTKKWATGAAAMLLGASLLLTACADGAQPVVDSNVAPTVEPVMETPETPEEMATPAVDDSDMMTDTEGMDDSDTMTDTEGMDDTTSMDSSDTMAMMGVSGVASNQYVRASTLLDYDFENLNDEVSGDLEDLLIDLNTGRVLFASIEYGGVLDLGDKDLAVPLNAFIIGSEGELVLNIDETALESYPETGDDWPNLDDPMWDDDVNTYWTETGIDVGPGYEEATGSVAWASEVIGHNIADLGVGAGAVLDVLVNLGTGHANYLIVDYGGGLDTDPYIIPLSAYNVSDWETGFAYGPDFTPDMLEDAPRYDQEMYPDDSSLDGDFGDTIESWWNDMGFSNDLNNDGQLD